SAELESHKEREAVGGVSYIASLTEGLPRRLAIKEYVGIVKDKAILRRLMAICASASSRASNQTEQGIDLTGYVIGQLEDAVMDGSQGKDIESVGQWLNQNDVFAERVPGVYTGIDDYDEMTYGLHPGELTVFAGRTSMGKTSHCGTIAWQMAKRGKSVAVFINEQQKASFIGRMLCGSAQVSFNAYRRGQLDWVEKRYIEDAVAEFKSMRLFLDQRGSMSVASIKAKANRMKRSGELDAILIDQLSRISAEGVYVKGMRSDEVLGAK